jgi:hypothetical protein
MARNYTAKNGGMAKNEENARQRPLDGKDPSGRTVKKMLTAKPYQGTLQSRRTRQSTKGIAVHVFA